MHTSFISGKDCSRSGERKAGRMRKGEKEGKEESINMKMAQGKL